MPMMPHSNSPRAFDHEGLRDRLLDDLVALVDITFAVLELIEAGSEPLVHLADEAPEVSRHSAELTDNELCTVRLES